MESVDTKPSSIWTYLQSKVLLQDDIEQSDGQLSAGETDDSPGKGCAFNVWELVRQRTNPALYRPGKITETEIAQLKTSAGKTTYMLRNCLNDKYLSLGEEGLFLWNLIDGKNTVKDLNIEYISAFGQMGQKVIANFLELLKKKGFLLDKPAPVYAIVSAHLKQNRASSRFKQAITFITHSRFSSGKADTYFKRLYEGMGFIFFSKPILILIFLLLAVDLGLSSHFMFIKHESMILLAKPGSHDVIAMMIIYYLSVFIHENAHGLTVKHYKRKVIRGGVLVMYGSPLPYVDTTDIWMKNRGPRMAASFAGPCANGVIGGIFLILAWIIPESIHENLFMHAGFVNSLIFVCNLIPIVETDGHYIIQDWLERPRLRAESLAFVKKEMWLKLVKREPWTRWDYAHLIYGSVAVLGLAYMIYAGLHLWEHTFAHIAREAILHPRMVLEILSVSVTIALVTAIWKFRLLRRGVNVGAVVEYHLHS
ncbi:hypothetical protein [Candidatus Formimonas warabiya]|uniref:Uncharacterized protein n=1 Tax=Formimonas warabiya TaxID=1761012 RepID=A0A3G1KWI2_FORW1|nr:hypothetical protein [Candidatus Formimonas warabiya]ATW26812.1 hypothetical protein DCMF_20405 [Candidatus Formimonas warabiya]